MEKEYDLIVIGGGPSGMMAAGIAAQNGAKVLLLEKNKGLGKKILITGKGRCNVTTDKFDVRELVKIFGQNGPFLFSSLTKFGPESIIDFFEEQGIKLKIERGGRVFPESDMATDIVGAMKKFMKKNGVEIVYDSDVKKLNKPARHASLQGVAGGKKSEIKSVILKNGKEFSGKNFLISTGGLSYPTTGSVGEGHKIAEKLGHVVVDTAPALVPLTIKEKWCKDLMGLTLKNVSLTILQENKKLESRQGDMLFAHFGITGPIVLDISKYVLSAKKNGKVELNLNLKPALSVEQLDLRLQRDFKKYNNKQFKNALGDLLPKNLIPILIEMSGIDPDKKVNSINKKERLDLVNLVQNITLTVTGDKGYNMAIVTSGGVNIKEIDPKTMKSKLIDNLYFAGEIIDIDAPTGGYNLTAAWSTGHAVGEAIDF